MVQGLPPSGQTDKQREIVKKIKGNGLMRNTKKVSESNTQDTELAQILPQSSAILKFPSRFCQVACKASGSEAWKLLQLGAKSQDVGARKLTTSCWCLITNNKVEQINKQSVVTSSDPIPRQGREYQIRQIDSAPTYQFVVSQQAQKQQQVGLSVRRCPLRYCWEAATRLSVP